MKKLMTAVAAGMILLGAYGASQAVPLPLDFSYDGTDYTIVSYDDGVNYAPHNNSGTYLGTVKTADGTGTAQDSEGMLEAVLAALGTPVDIETTAKVDPPPGTTTEGFTLTVTTDEGGKSGTWSTGTPPDALVSYYTVKSSTQFALYQVSPAAGSGYWDCGNLQNNGGNTPSISHFSAVGTKVPEPGTLLLLGSGLLGLGLMRRKKNF